MTTHQDRPHHIDCQSKYLREMPEFPGQRMACSCGEGTRDVFCALPSDFMGLQGIATFFARMQEAIAHMWQHEETGRIGFVDQQQIEWGFEKNNPRMKLVAELYAHPVTPAAEVPATGELKLHEVGG